MIAVPFLLFCCDCPLFLRCDSSPPHLSCISLCCSSFLDCVLLGNADLAMLWLSAICSSLVLLDCSLLPPFVSALSHARFCSRCYLHLAVLAGCRVSECLVACASSVLCVLSVLFSYRLQCSSLSSVNFIITATCLVVVRRRSSPLFLVVLSVVWRSFSLLAPCCFRCLSSPVFTNGRLVLTCRTQIMLSPVLFDCTQILLSC